MENHGGAATVAQSDDPTLSVHLPGVGRRQKWLHSYRSIAGLSDQPLKPDSLPGPACHSTTAGEQSFPPELLWLLVHFAASHIVKLLSFLGRTAAVTA